MGRASLVLCVLLAAGCQKIFDVREVPEGDGGGGGGISFVHAYAGEVPMNGLTVPIKFDEPPVAGDLIVVFAATWHNVPSQVLDSTGKNSYTMAPATGHSAGGSNLYLFYAYNVATTSPFGVVVNSTASTVPGDELKNELTVAAHVYRGASTTDSLDSPGATAGDGSPDTTVSQDCGMIQVGEPEVMVAATTRDFNGSTSVSPGWTLRTSVDQPHASYMTLSTSDRITAGGETSDPVFSTTHTADGFTWACVRAGFR